MSVFFEKLTNKSNSKKIKDTIKKVGRGVTLRMLADEEPDEEKKAALEAMAEDMEPDETEDACKTEDDLNENTNLSNSETQDGDTDQTEEEITEQKRVVDTLENVKKARAIIKDAKIAALMDAEISSLETKLADSVNTSTGKKTTEVLDMNKKELAELIGTIVVSAVDTAMTARLGDAGKDITLDGDPTVVEEFEVDDGFPDNTGEPEVVDEFEVDDMYGSDNGMGGEISPDQLYEVAKNSQNPIVANLARSLAGEIEKVSAEAGAESMESEDEGFVADMSSDMQVDAPPSTEEARLESAAEGDAPEDGTPSNQGTEAEMESMTKDGDKEKDIVNEKDGYFIPKKLADAAVLPVLMGNVLDTVSTYGLEGIDAQAHLKDGTIYHRLIDASGIGTITSSKGITSERVTIAINAIRKNRQMVDGMSNLIDSKLKDSSKSGFSPADEL